MALNEKLVKVFGEGEEQIVAIFQESEITLYTKIEETGTISATLVFEYDDDTADEAFDRAGKAWAEMNDDNVRPWREHMKKSLHG